MKADYKLKIGGTDAAGNIELVADDEGECVVATVISENADDPKVVRKDAERIVKAWNGYDDMRDALEDCIEALGAYLQSVESGKDDDAESAYQYGFAVLAETGKAGEA